MVQLKYFGDSRDYFKYDLITYLFQCGIVSNYVFVPMLTRDRHDGEGSKEPRYIPGKSKDLLAFINNCKSKDLGHWQAWLKHHVRSYITLHPVNQVFFEDANRHRYWEAFDNALRTKNALIFVDPDTGLETGAPSYLRRMGREKYILDEELEHLCQRLDPSSLLMIYQHLPRNRDMHKQAVDKKIEQAVRASGSPYVLAYREDDLAFLFIAKEEELFSRLSDALQTYHQRSGHAHKSIHWAPDEVRERMATSGKAQPCH